MQGISMSSVRTRFAPSPTGYLHVGGLRTALYNYLYAKKKNGSFILRIEDTDQNRKVEGAVKNLIDTLHWAGVDFDEGPGTIGAVGPYVQSERLTLYQQHAYQLVNEGKAYHCFCSAERLEEIRQKLLAMKSPISYDRFCRDLPKEMVETKLRSNASNVIRMKMPLEGEVTFNDLIRGKVTIANTTLDDQVILKSDGFPTYHLAVVVDDHYMNISHVIRGEEWLPSTSKHVLLYKSFNWPLPQFAHLPLLLNPDKSKLSKRQGDVAVEDYRAKGYVKEGLLNFIALLGWNPGDNREIFSLQELIQEFSIERVGKSGAIFNIDKLNWLNQQHLRLLPNSRIAELIKPLLAEKGWSAIADDYLFNVIELMKERVTVLGDFVNGTSYFFEDPVVYDEKGVAKNWSLEIANRLHQLALRYTELEIFTAGATEQLLREEAERLQSSAGKLIHPLRLALTGVSLGPSLFHLIEILGKETTLRRIEQAIEKIPV
jgi:glutamyl-tRNA synthetase